MNKKRILIVDDDINAATITRLMLERPGLYDVRVLNQPSQAVSVAREFRPDLVLLDVCMPDVEGGEVASKFTDDPLLTNTMVVFLTSIVTQSEAGRSGTVRIGAHEYIAKPVRSEMLLAYVANRLAQAHRGELAGRQA